MTNERNETIAAVATGTGGAVALIRISGERAVPIGDALFRSSPCLRRKDIRSTTERFATAKPL